MRSAYLLVFVSLLGGCASSSGVLPAEKGTYLVSQEHRAIYSTLNTVRHASINEAMDFCEQRDQDFELLAVESTLSALEQHPSASIRFQCVEKRYRLQFGTR